MNNTPNLLESQITTPTTNRGVEFFEIDWLTVTVHVSADSARYLYNVHFREFLGELKISDKGAMGYRGAYDGVLGFRILHTPASTTGAEYVTFVFPGQTCKAVAPEYFILFLDDLRSSKIRYKVTRIDTAFSIKFAPVDLYNSIKIGNIRSLAKRDTLRWYDSPFEKQENSEEIGCQSCYLGSRTSERMVRCYNKHGYNRLEVEYKGDRAQLVADSLLSWGVDMRTVAIKHLRDFMDILEDYWTEFVNNIERAYAKIVKAAEVELSKIVRWLDRQVSSSLSVVMDVLGSDFVIQEMVKRGRSKRGNKYDALMSLCPVGS